MNRFAAALATAILFAGLAAPAVAGDPVGVERGILNASQAAAQIAHLHPLLGIAGVNVNLEVGPRVPGNDRAYDVRIMAERNAASINRLRAALNANAETRNALAKRGIPIKRIIGAQIFSGGWLRVFIL